MQSVTKPPEDRSQKIAQEGQAKESYRVMATKRMLESSLKDFQQRKEEESTLNRMDDFMQVTKFKKDLEDEKEEKRQRREENMSHGDCLKNQMTMDKAKKLVEEEQRRAMLTSDPKERAEIIRRLKEKIKMIVKCRNC
jgi:hypothetical protein